MFMRHHHHHRVLICPSFVRHETHSLSLQHFFLLYSPLLLICVYSISLVKIIVLPRTQKRQKWISLSLLHHTRERLGYELKTHSILPGAVCIYTLPVHICGFRDKHATSLLLAPHHHCSIIVSVML